MRAKHDRLGAMFKGILDGLQGGVDACCACGDVVLWYIEVHMGGNLFVLGGHLINLQFAQALVLVGRCWCFASGFGILFGRVLDQASTNKRDMIQD